MNYRIKINFLIYAALLLLYANSVLANEPTQMEDNPPPLFKQFFEEGKAALSNKNYEVAISTGLSALTEAEEKQYDIGIYKANTLLAKAYREKNDYKNAAYYYSQILEYPNITITLKRKARTLSNLGDIYHTVGNYEEAFQNHYDALQIYEILKDTSGLKRAYYNIGFLEFYQKNYDQSIEWYEKIINLVDVDNFGHAYLRVLVAMASSNEEMGKLETAIRLNSQVLELIGGNPKWSQIEAYALQNLGTAYTKMNNAPEAESHLIAALNKFLASSDESGVVKTRKFLAQLYLQSQENRAAINELNKALPLCRKIKEYPQLLEILFHLAEAYERIGDSKTSLKYLKEHKILSDSIQTQEKLKAIEYTKVSYDIEKSNQEIAYLKKDKELLEKDNQLAARTNGFFFIILALLVAFLLWMIQNNRIRAALNKELAEKNQQIEQQNRRLEEYNKDLQQFAYVASHDLKSPMRTIKSYSTVIARKYKNDIPEEGKVYLKYIEEAIAKMQSLLEETLLFAKSRKENNVDAVSVAIRPVLKDCLFNLQSEIEESKVSIHIQKEAFPKVECNKTQLLQVFQNLVSNAIKFKGSEHPKITIRSTVEGSFSRFSVKDNGVGIPAESQSSIFEMFSRAENTQNQEGSGIGLATCKKIINHFGGKIWVESNQQGSNFFFTLPIVQEDLEKFVENKDERLIYLRR